MKLVHITDPHLDHVDDLAARAGAEIELTLPEDAVVVITGDIAVGDSFSELLTEFALGLQRRVYFLLGNHDAWMTTWEGARRTARKLTRAQPQVTYLAEAGVIELAPGVALCGVDGFYDARAGAGVSSSMRLNDWLWIGDLRGLHRERRREVLEQHVNRETRRARELLTLALACYQHVYFATHVPPFPQASLDPYGRPADPEAIPWYCNVTLGYALDALAGAYRDKRITVLCGHTHGAADVEIAPNLRVIVGAARYGTPSVAGLHEVG